MLLVHMVLQLCTRPEEDQLWVQVDAPCFGLAQREPECLLCLELLLRLQDPHTLNMTYIDLFDLMETSLLSFYLMMKVLEGLLGLEDVQELAQCPKILQWRQRVLNLLS